MNKIKYNCEALENHEGWFLKWVLLHNVGTPSSRQWELMYSAGAFPG